MATKADQQNQYPAVDGKGRKIGIVVSEWNREVTERLYESCRKTLLTSGVADGDIHVVWVPGSFELPMGAKILLASDKFDAVICLGCVIKGQTKHDEYISSAVANGIMHLSLHSGVPVIFGVLTPNTMEQALARAGGAAGDKGREAALTALQMAVIRTETGIKSSKIGFS